MLQILNTPRKVQYSTPKSRFNEARFNESHDLVNKCQTFLLIPSLDLVKFHDLMNKSSLTRSFVKSRFGCITNLCLEKPTTPRDENI